MGKKGVLLDNGKTARSSMALYWKAGQNKNQNNAAKKEPREEDIEDRAEEGKDKWKIHKEKYINKLYQKPQKKDKGKQQQIERQQKKEEEQFERDMLQKQMNKNKPVKIAGFKNMEQLRAKMQFQQVKVGNNSNNKLIPRNPAEQLSEAEIIQILREKKAKKQLQRAHKQRIQKNLRERKVHEDLIMDGLLQNKNNKLEAQKKIENQEQQNQVSKQKQPEQFFKSDLLQKIEKGEHFKKKQEKMMDQKVEVQKEQNTKQPIQSKFVPRALWNK